MRYTLDENRGDIRYEVDGDMLILKIRPEFIENIPIGQILTVIKSEDSIIPSDYNVFSAKRVLMEIEKASGSGGKPTALYKENLVEKYLYASDADEKAFLEYSLIGKKDIVCYATDDTIEDVEFPIATANVLGLIKVGEGLSITADGVLSVTGGTGGLDIQKLEEYLRENKYYNYQTKLTGYYLPEKYTPINENDTILSAFGKLEKNFSNYVDLFNDQIIDGTKTFKQTIFGQQDIVCYATDSTIEDVELPIASKTTLGVVKIGENLTISADGTLSATGGGSGINFTTGSGLNLTSENVLEVVFGNSAGTVCQGNDSRLSNARKNPYSLSWSGYDSGSYDGSSAKTINIPNDTNQLTNGAGFIRDANGNFTSLSGSGSSSKYLAGNGTFYTIDYDELSGTPDLSVYVKKSGDTMTGNLTIDKSLPTLYLSGSRTWGVQEGSGDLRFLNNGTLAAYFSGVNNGNLALKGSLIVDGDVVCYSVGSGSDVDFSISWNDISGKPSWIGSSKPSYSWGEISGKPTILSSITYSTSGSGNAVTKVTASGNTVYVTYGNISGGGDWSGGKVDNAITIGGTGNRLIFDSITNKGGIKVQWNEMALYNTNDYSIHFDTGGTRRCSISSYLWVQKAWAVGSDIRYKNRLDAFVNVLEKISKLEVFRYSLMNEDNTIYIGSSAQQMMSIFPEFASYNPQNDRYAILYDQAGYCIAVQGIKELYLIYKLIETNVKNINLWQHTKDEQIEQLQQDNLALKARIEVLEKGGDA